MTGPKNQIPAIYGRAIKKYREITDDTLEVDFLEKFRNSDDLMNEIDARNAKFSGNFARNAGFCLMFSRQP